MGLRVCKSMILLFGTTEFLPNMTPTHAHEHFPYILIHCYVLLFKKIYYILLLLQACAFPLSLALSLQVCLCVHFVIMVVNYCFLTITHASLKG